MGNEFKIEVPIEVTNKNSSGSSGGSGSSGSSGGNAKQMLGPSFGKMAGAVAVGTLATKALSVASESLMKILEPLVNILKALFVVIFLPFLPLIMALTKLLGSFITWMLTGGPIGTIVNWILSFLVVLGLILLTPITLIPALIIAAVLIVISLIVTFWDQILAGLAWIWEGVKWYGEKLVEVWTVLLEFILFIAEVVAGLGLMIWEWFVKGFSAVAHFGNWVWELFLSGLSSVADFGKWMWDLIKSGLSALANLGTLIWDYIKSALGKMGSFFGGGKASGGPVSGGTTYMVGEQGPELFTPNGSGNITPNDKLGGSGTTINISGNSFKSESDMRKMVDMISRELQKRGARSSSR